MNGGARYNVFPSSGGNVSPWSSQAAWFIDPVSGSDAYSGNTAAQALKTWAEFTRRVRVVSVAMTVTILSDIAEPLIGSFVASGLGLSLTILGSPTVAIVATGTTFTDPVRSGAQAMGTMTAANVADWTAYNGKILRSSDSRYAPILGISGLAPLLPYWSNESLSATKPANGTDVDVLTLPTAPTVAIDGVGLTVAIKLLKFNNATFTSAPSLYTSAPGLGASFVACEFASAINTTTAVYLIACLLTGSGSVSAKAQINFAGGGSSGRTFFHNSAQGNLAFSGFVMNGGAGLQVGNGTNASTPSSISSSGNGLGIFNSTAAGLVLGSNANASLQALFGNGNATYGMQIGNGARCWVAASPTITGATAELQFCGAGTAIPPLTAGAAVPAASALTTWAQFAAAPFSSKVMNYGNGTVLAGA